MTLVDESETRDRLLNNLKKDVKQLMELSATCKFIHEDNHCFNNLCTSIDLCILHGLKKDFLNRSSSFDLLKKIAKECKEARKITDIFQDLDKSLALSENKKNSISLSNTNNTYNNGINFITKIFNTQSKITNPETINHYVPLYMSNLKNIKYLWIKIAILNKSLNDIIDFILKNSLKYYQTYALLADPFEGALFASLIAGPCAFDKYTRFKTIENAEPDADELIRRHKMHIFKQSPHKSPCLKPKSKITSININPTHIQSNQNLNLNNIKEFIESLHQNVKSQLIYGKNHVIVNQKEKSFAGYLSLHLHPTGLILNWTPNEILNGEPDDLNNTKSNKINWNELIIYINLDSISFIHCHEQNTSLIVIFVSRDGAQSAPIIFNDASSLSQFLTSIETGLFPQYKLQPDSWKSLIDFNKMPLIIQKVYTGIDYPHSISSVDEEIQSTQIFTKSTNDLIKTSPLTQLMSQKFPNFADNILLSPINNQTNPTKEMTYSTPENQIKIDERTVLKNLCDDMKYKLIHRAFYGWLNYHKQTKTVNKHLVKLINFSFKKDDLDLKLNESNEINALLNNELNAYLTKKQKLDDFLWSKLIDEKIFDKDLFYELIYFNGIQTNDLRKKVWPYLLEIYNFEMNQDDLELKNKLMNNNLNRIINEWKPFEEMIRINDEKKLNSSVHSTTPSKENDSGICPDLTVTTISSSSNVSITTQTPCKPTNIDKKGRYNLASVKSKQMQTPILSNESSLIINESNTSKLSSFFGFNSNNSTTNSSKKLSKSRSELFNLRNDSGYSIENDLNNTNFKTKFQFFDKFLSKIKNKTADDDVNNNMKNLSQDQSIDTPKTSINNCTKKQRLTIDEINKELAQLLVSNAILKAKYELESSCDSIQHENASNEEILLNDEKKCCIESFSPNKSFHDETKSNKTDYSIFSPYSVNQSFLDTRLNDDLLKQFALNIHRIDKDVLRCDRNYWYFSSVDNLNKLRNIIYSYVWETIDIGYIQGMCDLIAPLLVIFDNESIVYECFKMLMKKMSINFVSSGEMDKHFSNMRCLVQVLDQELFEHMNSRGDHTQFYFTYRWFLLDFKRELVYKDIFIVWETIWASKHYIKSDSFQLFIALALIESYRDIILENNMEFTDIIKFFNEMSEKHDIKETLDLARDLVEKLRTIIANKYD